MLLIWYNPHHRNFYITYTRYSTDKYVGYENQYDHFVVQMFCIYDKKLFNVFTDDFLFNHSYRKQSLKKRFIKRLIRFLNKFED